MNNQAGRGGGAGLPAHEQVYRTLRDMVLFGELAPGQAVTIQGLVADLGTGMTPVREALRRLTAEGALEALGNRRIVVPQLTAPAVEEMTRARTALEPMLARHAAERAGPADIAALAETDSRLDQAIARGDIGAYLKENHQFHAQFNALAQAPIITALVESLWLRFGPSLRVVCGQVGTRNLPDRHKELLDALERRDGAAAAVAIEKDVVQGMSLILHGLAGAA
ncbi:GntR family transcriptional regulator [Primorskyibacter sp. 2E107]|uniref:GntR family transcriptional regulator n=1 Tax=Primorskyibacter sp. 2E107 TaxID=3403458 RepID=UPI003AF460E6